MTMLTPDYDRVVTTLIVLVPHKLAARCDSDDLDGFPRRCFVHARVAPAGAAVLPLCWLDACRGNVNAR
jgi:hypothetical protein